MRLDKKLYRAKLTVKEMKSGASWTRYYDHALTRLEELEAPVTERAAAAAKDTATSHSPEVHGRVVSVPEIERPTITSPRLDAEALVGQRAPRGPLTLGYQK